MHVWVPKPAGRTCRQSFPDYPATGDLSNTRLAAQARRDHAISALMTLHRHAVQLVDAVALSGISAGRWMMQHNGGSPNEALNLLRHAATALAKHYGFRT
jgi:hypothetical protein